MSWEISYKPCPFGRHCIDVQADGFFFYTCNNYAKVSFRRAVLKCYLFFFQLDSLLYTNVELRAHATNIFLDLCVVKLVIMQDQFWYFFTQFIEFQFLSGKIIANQKLHEMSFRKFSSC